MSELGKWVGGGTPSKADSEFWAGGTVPWLTPKDMSVNRISDTEDHVTKAALDRGGLRIVPAGSVAVVMRSNILRRRLPTALVTVPVTLNQDVRALVPRPGVQGRYVAEVLRACASHLRKATVRTDGSMAAVRSAAMMRYRIPLPSEEDQETIMSILGKFDALVNDLSFGLPAELAARRIQYEHYRDRLLKFEERAA